VRKPTKEEQAWCSKVRSLMKKMPPTMALFADGHLEAVDRKELDNYNYIATFQPLVMENLGICEGGDPWKHTYSAAVKKRPVEK